MRSRRSPPITSSQSCWIVSCQLGGIVFATVDESPIERGAALACPELEDLPLRIVGQVRDEEGRPRQPAPRRIGVGRERRGERQRAVLVGPVGIAAVAEHAEVLRRPLLRRDHRRPPLVDDVGHVERAEELVRRVGVHDGERRARLDLARGGSANQLALMRDGVSRSLQRRDAARQTWSSSPRRSYG